jgi:predicted ferric reductase
LGLGSFELFGGWAMYVFIGMVLISIAGFVISYRKHQCLYPLLIAIPSAISIFYGFFSLNISPWIYIGMFGMLAATIVNYYRNRLHGNCDTCTEYNGEIVELETVITCPECGHKKTEMMPTNSCQYFYECENCKKVLKPLQGDCCVYCSYGSVKCPPTQAGDKCC